MQAVKFCDYLDIEQLLVAHKETKTLPAILYNHDTHLIRQIVWVPEYKVVEKMTNSCKIFACAKVQYIYFNIYSLFCYCCVALDSGLRKCVLVWVYKKNEYVPVCT